MLSSGPMTPVQAMVLSSAAAGPAAPAAVSAAMGSPGMTGSEPAVLTQGPSPRAPWFIRSRNATLATVGTLMTSAPAFAEPTEEAASGDTAGTLMDHASVLPWTEISEMGLLVAGAALCHRSLGKKIARLKNTQEATEKQKSQALILRWSRWGMWGLATYLGFRIAGIDLTNLFLGAGGIAAVVSLTTKNIISDFTAYLLLTLRGNIDTGDEVALWNAKGTVMTVGLTHIMVSGVDENGCEYVSRISTSTFISRAVKEAAYDRAFLEKIGVGDYISVRGDFGRVATITDHTIGIERRDPNGKIWTDHIQKLKITPDSTVLYGSEVPALPGGADKGWRIRLGDVEGVIMEHDAWDLWLRSDDEVEHKKSRNAFESDWSIISRPEGTT